MKTKKEVCSIFNICLATLNNWIKKGLIKPVKIGKSVRFTDEEIERVKRGE